MNLLVLSYKIGWQISDREYLTYGGFPLQMEALSTFFAKTKVTLLIRPGMMPGGTQPIYGRNIEIFPLPEPDGSGLRRKLALLAWLPCHLPQIWREIARADAVHTPVPGDIGFIGLLIALLQRKPLFVRHCGTWGEPVTHADRLLLWLLEKIAGGRNVVLATGGAEAPPSVKNPHIRWIFSTSLTQSELDSIHPAVAWDGHSPLRLVTVGRVTDGKNMAAIIDSLPAIRAVHPETTLDILGEGEARLALEARASDLGLRSVITFHGNVSHAQVLDILSHSHLFVFPSRTKEGFPKAVLEALACGLPVIATRISVIPQLLQNGAGLLLDATTAEAVASATLQVASNPAHMAKMGRLARDVAQGYTLEAWAAAIGEHLKKAWDIK